MTERLRIAVLSRNFSTTGGGAERYSIAVVEQLAARHEVHVFAQTIAHDFPGVTYHRVPMLMERPRWINQLYFAWKTWRATRAGFDVVHSHENSWYGNVQTVHVLPVKHTLFAGKQGAALALRWLKVATSPRLLAYLWLESMRYRVRPGRYVVATSRTLAQVMVQTYPAARHMLRTIPPGVSRVEGVADAATKARARQRLNLPLGMPLLLFVGNDMRKKGLPTLLQAMVQLPRVHLALVGQGEHTQTMHTLAQPMADRVHFLGALPDVADAYRAADVLVHPTQEDTYAMVVLEAMSHGLPVVVSGERWCGIAAELQDGVNALLLDAPQDVAGLVRNARMLLDDAACRHELSSAAVLFARKASWGEVARQYEDLMRLAREST